MPRTVVVANRNHDRARSVAERVGGLGPAAVPARTRPSPPPTSSSRRPGRPPGSSSLDDVRAALAARDGRPQVYVDLALPHDVDLAVADLPGATRVGLGELGDDLADAGSAPQVAEAADLVTAEVAAYLLTRSAEAVAPTVTALRTHAALLVEEELRRLERRMPDLTDAERAEVRRTVQRVVDKLLHTPTVRVKELARDGQGGSYARALSELFDLDPRDVSLVSAPPTHPGRRRMTALRLGTRRSALATTQSTWVADRLRALGHEVELVEVSTEGDLDRTTPLAQLGGTGVFVSALRTALAEGRVDLAVHSLKDLPTTPDDATTVAAVPTREDPRDALVARDGLTLGELPAGATVGTGSPRRRAQLEALGLGLVVTGLRGNVDTRMRAVTEGRLDAVVLAAAGLRRLGRIDEATELLDPIQMLPAPGQGALAVEVRADDAVTASVVAALDDADTRACTTAERALLAELEAGCSAPVGALAEVVEGVDGPELSLRAVVTTPDGSADLRRSLVGDVADPASIGRRLARLLLEDGAADLMSDTSPLPTADHLATERAP